MVQWGERLPTGGHFCIRSGQVHNTGHGSLFYQYRNNPNRVLMLTLGQDTFV